MGLLQEKQIKCQRMLDYYNNETRYYNNELSEEVKNQKLQWQTEMVEFLENDNKNDIVLDVDGMGIKIEVEVYDYNFNTTYITTEDIIKVASVNGEVYVEDRNENEYYIDDLDKSTFKKIHDVVIEMLAE